MRKSLSVQQCAVCQQARAAQSSREADKQYSTATTQLQVVTDRLNQVQMEAHQLRVKLHDAGVAKQELEAKLSASVDVQTRNELQGQMRKAKQYEAELAEQREHMHSMDAALQRAQQQKAVLENTVSSLIMANDELHMHVQSVRTLMLYAHERTQA